METVTHDGRTTAYRTSTRGDGRRILCVHGSGGTHQVWRAQLGRLAAGRTVAALDLSGHGDSADVDVPPEDAIDAYVDDVAAVADAVDADVLIGNSLGGAVVLSGCLDGRLDPEGAVLVGSGARLAVGQPLREWLAHDFDRAVDFLHEPDRLFHDPDPRLTDASRAAMRDAGRATVERDFLACHNFDARDRLPGLDVPLLALTGDHDTLTPPRFSEYLADHVDRGEWTTLPDAAHLAFLETPDAFNREVDAFLAALD